MNFHEYFTRHQVEVETGDFYRFLEVLHYLDDEVLIPRDIDGGVFNFLPLLVNSSNEGYITDFVEFSRMELSRPLVGIDSSVVPIAESRDGFVLGLKGTIIVERGGGYEVVRVGPMPMYISLKLVEFYSKLSFLPKSLIRRAAVDIGWAKKFAVSVFEDTLVSRVVESYSGVVVLMDGSLSSPFLGYRNRMVELCDVAREKNISIVGLSKKSRLLKRYPELYSFVLYKGLPGAIKVPGFIIKRKIPFSIYISLFSVPGVPFRVDLFINEAQEVVLNEIFSSSLSNIGYPEVLKEAHILSKISKFELIALKKFLEMKGARFVATEKLRDVLFGEFNRSGSWGGLNEGV
jgi:hypothetical protein